MKKFLLLFSLVSLVTTCFISCKKEIKTKWVYFDETGLYPWGPIKQDGTEDEKIKDAVKNRMAAQNVKILEIKIENDGLAPGQMACTSAYCKTGRRIHCKVTEKDVVIMINNGFYE